MSHIVRNAGWGTVSLNTETGHVFVREDWRYNWTVVPPATAWTLSQRRRFHNTLDRQVWSTWSNRVRLRVAGGNPIVRRFPAGLPPVEFDVHWVTNGGHWTVNVRKLPPGSNPTTFISNVVFPARRIELDSADVDSYQANNAGGASREFHALPHEFGHTMPDATGHANQDEYRRGSAHLADADSIMNIGRQLRPRHLTALLTELNAMLPDAVFSA